MPSEEYAAAARGSLKIKGVQGAKVDKQKKKKKSKNVDNPKDSKEPSDAEKNQKTLADALAEEDGANKDEFVPGSNMTEAERQSYERRYKMLEDRLKKEGVKSHKERVENLNRYLSTLSEHHDMPRIGPG